MHAQQCQGGSSAYTSELLRVELEEEEELDDEDELLLVLLDEVARGDVAGSPWGADDAAA